MTIDVTSLLLGLVFGSIGFGYFIYGKKRKNKLIFWVGIALMVLPYVITNNVLVVIVSLALILTPYYIK